jgi:hypothetical protein
MRRGEELEAAAGEEARLRALLCVGVRGALARQGRDGSVTRAGPGRAAVGLTRRPPEISPAAGTSRSRGARRSPAVAGRACRGEARRSPAVTGRAGGGGDGVAGADLRESASAGLRAAASE